MGNSLRHFVTGPKKLEILGSSLAFFINDKELESIEFLFFLNISEYCIEFQGEFFYKQKLRLTNIF